MASGPWWNRDQKLSVKQPSRGEHIRAAAKRADQSGHPIVKAMRRARKTADELENDRRIWRARSEETRKSVARQDTVPASGTPELDAVVPVRHQSKSGITLAGRNRFQEP